MALIKWTTGDTITEREANDFGVRKGTESEIAAIAAADREDGSLLYNSTNKNPQVYITASTDKRGNIKLLIGADATEVSVTGTTATERKNISYVKNTSGFSGNIITVVAEMRNSNSGSTAHLRVRKDGGGSDALDLTTTSTTYNIQTGTIDISGDSAGRHTLEIYLDSGVGHTAFNRELEIYGI